MRLLLSGYYGFGNLGDELLLQSIVGELRRRRPYAEIDVLSAQPDLTAHELRVDATPRWDMKAVRNAIDRADVVLSGGGGLLQNATSLRSLLYYTGVIRAAVRAGRPTMIFAQSIGPLDFWGRTVVRETCKGVTAATVRDDRSRTLLSSLLPSARVERAGDPAFLYDGGEEIDLQREGLGGDQPFAIVSVRKAPGVNERVESIARAVDRLREMHGFRVAFLPFGGQADAEVSTTVIRKCKTAPMLLPETTPGRAAAIIARARAVLGMRLHALILAAKHAVPFLAIPYDPKVSAFCDDLRYPEPELLTIDARAPKPAPEAIDRAIDGFCERLDSLRAHLAGSREALERSALRNFEVLDEVLTEKHLE